ncbi:MAG: helix-turn-helix transcriptional regulator [Pseudomonadota bacterium]
MHTNEVLAALSALGHPRRLEAFRLLVTMGEQGLLAGEVADRLQAKQNTMSTNLSVLLRAGLVRAVREGRGVRYSANMDTFARMLQFLITDCCSGNPKSHRVLTELVATPQVERNGMPNPAHA